LLKYLEKQMCYSFSWT